MSFFTPGSSRWRARGPRRGAGVERMGGRAGRRLGGLCRAVGGDVRLGPVVRSDGPGDELAVDPHPLSDRLGLVRIPAVKVGVGALATLVVRRDVRDEAVGLA